MGRVLRPFRFIPDTLAEKADIRTLSTREDVDQRSAPDIEAARRSGARDSTEFLPVWAVYLISAVLSTISFALITRVWRADWKAPFFTRGDAVASAAHFRTTIDTGWYEFTDKLGAPYGQHYHDFPFSDDLHPAAARLIGLFTDQAGLAFNLYYALGFPLAALTTTWFLRRCGVSQAMTIALAVLYAVAPYHLTRNEAHLFLASYYCVPLAMGVVVHAAAGQPLWGRRENNGKIWSVSTGTGALTALSLVLVTLSGAYYAVFTGILLAVAGIFAYARKRQVRRLGGVVAAGMVLIGTLAAAMLPDILYARANGSVAAAFVRLPQEAELYALKFSALILPAPGYRIPALAQLSEDYATNFPLPSERPALGLIAAVGFVILLFVVPIVGLASRSQASATRQRLVELSVLTWAGFISATVGGIGTLVALFLTDSIRGWNRMSIFLALLGLTAVGLIVDASIRRFRRSVGWAGRIRAQIISVVVAVCVLLVGLFDQSLKGAVPDYQASAAEWNSAETFVDDLSARVPNGAMIFQLPYMVFPEGGAYNGVYDSEQLKLYLHNSDLRWSGGGIKGRPQSDWPATVAAQDAPTMTRNLAIIGFEGIVIDRDAIADAGAALEEQLKPLLGAPELISPDGRYVYYSLEAVNRQALSDTTSEERSAIAAQITSIPPGQ